MLGRCVWNILGALYHVMSRGDRCEAIFRGDDDRFLFLESLKAVCEKMGWEVQAYCLMTNPFIWLRTLGGKWLVGGLAYCSTPLKRGGTPFGGRKGGGGIQCVLNPPMFVERPDW